VRPVPDIRIIFFALTKNARKLRESSPLPDNRDGAAGNRYAANRLPDQTQ
jgi:hypothetical protein